MATVAKAAAAIGATPALMAQVGLAPAGHGRHAARGPSQQPMARAPTAASAAAPAGAPASASSSLSSSTAAAELTPATPTRPPAATTAVLSTPASSTPSQLLSKQQQRQQQQQQQQQSPVLAAWHEYSSLAHTNPMLADTFIKERELQEKISLFDVEASQERQHLLDQFHLKKAREKGTLQMELETLRARIGLHAAFTPSPPSSSAPTGGGGSAGQRRHGMSPSRPRRVFTDDAAGGGIAATMDPALSAAMAALIDDDELDDAKPSLMGSLMGSPPKRRPGSPPIRGSVSPKRSATRAVAWSHQVGGVQEEAEDGVIGV